MLVLRIEHWPDDSNDETEATVLGVGVLCRVDGDERLSSYRAEMQCRGPKTKKITAFTSYVRDFPYKQRSVFDLLYEAIDGIGKEDADNFEYLPDSIRMEDPE